MSGTSIIIVIFLWVAAIPSGLKYYNLLNAAECDEKDIRKAKSSFHWSLFFAVGGTIATILGI